MQTRRSHDEQGPNTVTRRSFLGTTIGGSAALLTGGLTSLFPNSARAIFGDNSAWVEATIPKLERLMASGALTSRELVKDYLERIAELNPLLNAVIETTSILPSLRCTLESVGELARRRGHVGARKAHS